MEADLSPSENEKYWNERLTRMWGLQGVGHISYGVPYNTWLYRVRRKIFVREVRRLRTEIRKARVLDLGSGTGFWLNVWRSLGAGSITGADIAPVAVENLKKQHPQMQIQQLDISDPSATSRLQGKFDAISAIDVLFHITDDERFRMALRNISTLLSDSGYFVFSDNFAPHDGRRASAQVTRNGRVLEAELMMAGLQIARKVPMFAFMNAPVNSPSAAVYYCWRLLMYPMHLIPLLGHLYGPALYPLEMMATSVFRPTLSTSLAICKRVPTTTSLPNSTLAESEC